MDRREIDGEVRVGDEVECTAEQKTQGYFETSVIDTRVDWCGKA